jgi:hypothetical protein
LLIEIDCIFTSPNGISAWRNGRTHSSAEIGRQAVAY